MHRTCTVRTYVSGPIHARGVNLTHENAQSFAYRVVATRHSDTIPTTACVAPGYAMHDSQLDHAFSSLNVNIHLF